MKNIIENIRERAVKLKKHIVFPEGEDLRVNKAAGYLVENEICSVTLIGDPDNIVLAAQENESSIEIIDLKESVPHLEAFSERLRTRRKAKLENKAAAKKLLINPLFYGASMVDAGYADGCVGGSITTTGDVIRAALQCIGLKKTNSIVSSTFLMALKSGKALTYADCGVVPYPDARQLAEIAVESARTHQLLTQEVPKVAMLSFSTYGSAKHQNTELVLEALRLAKENEPDLAIDGELQFDAAFVPKVASRKAPNSAIAGTANVFIFPNLDAGNIAYKITERLGGATATGPILQGLAKPMMDLSRGCSWQDVVNAACVAALMGEGLKPDLQD